MDSNENQSDDRVVEIMAMAMEKSHIDGVKTKLRHHEFPIEEIKRTFDVALIEADRSSAILLFALVEDVMIKCLKTHMNPKVTGGWKSVTGSRGVLSTASNRLTVLELLYWVRERTSGDIRLMKNIRNHFAHRADVHEFNDRRITGWISSLTKFEVGVFNAVDYDFGKPSIRQLYLMRSFATITNLIIDLAMGPLARKEKLNPSVLYEKKLINAPENLQEITRLQALYMTKVMLGPDFEPSS